MLSVFQNRRFDGDFLTVSKLIQNGDLGEVKWIELAWQGFRPPRGWRAQASMGGGRYYDLGAHLVDQLCLLFPQAVESVYCRMHHDVPETDVETEALLVVAFEGGATGVCDFSCLAAISKPRFYVRGTGGTFRKYGLDPQEAAMNAGDIDSAVEDPAAFGLLHDGRTQRTIPTVRGRWRDYYENVAAVLNDHAEPLVKLDQVRRQIAVLDAGIQSARTGQVVRPDIPATKA
jgi:predicted dehydrogenase